MHVTVQIAQSHVNVITELFLMTNTQLPLLLEGILHVLSDILQSALFPL